MIKITQTLVTLENSASGYYDRAAICDHIMDGWMAGTFARFNNPEEEVSAHFGISKAGNIVQYVSMDRWAYANGWLEDGYDMSLPWLVECKAKGINPNRRTISIEHEALKGEGLTEAQYAATLELHKYIIKNWPTIKPDLKHIVGHRQISPKSKPLCPGEKFPFGRLIADLQEGLTIMPIEKVPGNFPVNSEFTRFWFAHGGLPIFGYPSGNEIAANGRYNSARAVQYFERARFEIQPDGSVTLGLVGNEAMKLREGPIK